MKKLARATAFRLAKEFLEKSKTKDGSAKKIENKFNIKPTYRVPGGPKISKPSFNSTNEVKRKKVETEKAINTYESKQNTGT